MGKKGKKLTLGPIQQAPELPTKTRTLRRHMDSKDADSPGKFCSLLMLSMCSQVSSGVIVMMLYGFQMHQRLRWSDR